MDSVREFESCERAHAEARRTRKGIRKQDDRKGGAALHLEAPPCVPIRSVSLLSPKPQSWGRVLAVAYFGDARKSTVTVANARTPTTSAPSSTKNSGLWFGAALAGS